MDSPRTLRLCYDYCMKTIVITGGSDGLGKALAENLSKDNRVIVLARSTDALKELADRTGCEYIVCDIKSAEEVQDAFVKIREENSAGIDVLINNAGIIVNGDLTETSYEDIANVIETNTLGSIYVTKEALTLMKEAKRGLIINVISQSGLTARTNRSIYNASKWALTGFTKALQQEAVAYGVRVTGFYPGTIKTKLFEKAGIELKGPALEINQIVGGISYLASTDDSVLIPEFGIKHLEG